MPKLARPELKTPLRILALLLTLVGALSLAVSASAPALAVEAVRVTLDAPVIDLTTAIERYRSDGDLIQISTAPGKDGIVRRIVVKARDAGARPDWIVFALTNDTDEQIDRILVAPHFRLVDSGVIWRARASARSATRTRKPTSSPSRWIPARPSPTSPSCAVPTSRSCTCGIRTPIAARPPG
ncbi:MAG: hypothetical protein K0Q54_498 [Methylobacterium brachiatum]|nr:hypothetical protein [Methylobacterium brachiatum]